MKIRNGFVSNSSSSSFLIVFKRVEVFNKFKLFNGYEKFINELRSYNKSDVKNFFYYTLLSSFDDEMYSSKEDISAFQIEMQSVSSLRFSIESILRKKIDELKFKDAFDLSEKIYQKKKELELSGMKSFEITNLLRRSFMNDVTKECKKISNVMLEELEKSDFNFCVLNYEDDSEFGSYMEHEFMPMVSMNVDNDDFIIIRKMNH